jgi:Tn3 transposase DDE domain
VEDQLGALGLVVNVMMLWTTLYRDRALGQLRGQEATINDDDVARLAPLGTNHINVLGRYHFSLPEAIARGEFRPLARSHRLRRSGSVDPTGGRGWLLTDISVPMVVGGHTLVV